MKARMRKLAVLCIAIAGMVFSTGVTAFAYTDEAAQQEAVVIEETDSTEETAGTEGTPFSVSGNGQLLDDKTDDDTKQFLTIQTKNGNTFFMVLDRSSSTDNVYMLSMIDENDLADFIEETETVETEETQEANEPAVVLPEQDAVQDVADTEADGETKTTKDSGNKGAMLAIGALAVAAIGGGYYLKVVKPGKDEEDSEGEDLEFYDGGAYINEDGNDAPAEDDHEDADSEEMDE